MKFDDIKHIFYKHIHRRYHRHCREVFAQLICLNLHIKPAFLFDLFPFSIRNMRDLLDNLTDYFKFPSLILKYSSNDLIIVNSLQLSSMIDALQSIFLIDLDTMNLTDHHAMLNKIHDHLIWIDKQKDKKQDFDDETNDEWFKLIQPLNHTTVFGYVLGYPFTYFHASVELIDGITLKNFRFYVKLKDLSDETLLYSFSCPIHLNIDQQSIGSIVKKWLSSLSIKIDSVDAIQNYHLEQHIRAEAKWCL